MNINVLSLRWLHCAGYEIKLPNEKTIVIDPFLTMNNFDGFTWENIEGADYILLTHTHGDHTSDVGRLIDKFGSKLIVGQMACNSIVEYFDLNYSYIWPVVPGEHLNFPDLTLDVYYGKHSELFRDDYKPSEVHRMPGIGGPEGSYRDSNHFGGMEFLNYGITTKEGLRILVAGGIGEDDNIYEEAKKFRPNLVLRQVNSMCPPKEYAMQVAPFQAQLVFPHHHEKIPQQYGISIEEYCSQVNEELENLKSRTRMVYPEKFHWVDIGMTTNLL